ncbi:MAG: LUD domain-containing protein [Eubacterium sp.]
MDGNVKKRNEVLAQTVIKGLQSRNMSGYYAEDKEAALKQALELIDEESTIAMGGCHSAQEIGLVEALKEELQLYRPFKDDSKRGTSGFI